MPLQSTPRPSPYRALDFLSRVPALSDIERLQMEALTTPSQNVQLPWLVGEPPCGYFMIASYGGTTGQPPKWALYKDNGKVREMLWVYQTHDTALIHNMLLCAFADQNLSPESHNTYAYFSGQNRSEGGAPSPNSSAGAGGTGAGSAGGTGVGSAGGTGAGSAGSESRLSVYQRHLRQIGVDERTVLQIVPLTAQEYVLATQDAIEVDVAIQFQMGKLMDGVNTLQEIITALKLPQEVWIPIVYNVLRCGLAQRILPDVSSKAASAGGADLASVGSGTSPNAASQNATFARVSDGSATSQKESQSVEAEAKTIESLKRAIYSRATGLLSYPAFQMFLNKEFQRFESHRRPFSLILLRYVDEGIELARDGGPLVTCLQSIIRHLSRADYLCHWGKNGLAILLPEVEKEDAKQLTLALLNSISQFYLSSLKGQSVTPPKYKIKIGSASVPDDGFSASTIILSAMENDAVVLELG
ncbi:MAG: diguanylate cyclase [Candidatus Obscuribacterales bacterium]|nr:diguanylate cyclase [Candidatus Obscuribacterales bacterium]